MPMTALELVDTARDHHPAFDRRTVPDKVALRYLNGYQRRLAARIANVSEDALLIRETIVTGTVNAAIAAGTGVPLARDPMLIVDITTGRGYGKEPVSLVSYINRQHGF